MKSKKIISGLLALSFVFGCTALPNTVVNNSVVASAATKNVEVFTYGDFKYTLLGDGTAEITRYIGKDVKIKIPAEIPVEISSEIINVPVTSIGESAFDETVKSINKIESISMPNSITTIRYGAFNTCSKLAEVKLSANLTTIEDYAFFRCRSLNKIVIPASVNSIGDSAFKESNSSFEIYCYNGSKAEKHALIKRKNFKILDVNDKTEFPVLREVLFNTKNHQFRMEWTEVEGAEEYGIAVYLSGKWRVQKQGIPADTTTYTSPKNTNQGQPKPYKVAIGAKINGKWDKDNAINNAIEILV